MSDKKNMIEGALIAIIISETLDVFGATEKIREILKNLKAGLQSNKDEKRDTF